MKKVMSMLAMACVTAIGMTGAVWAKGEKPNGELDGATKIQYRCELGKQVTVFHSPDEQDSITLRWNNKNHVLKREATTTGAHRFEDKKAGLVWINIPAKSILLDSRLGRQLANECKV